MNAQLSHLKSAYEPWGVNPTSYRVSDSVAATRKGGLNIKEQTAQKSVCVARTLVDTGTNNTSVNSVIVWSAIEYIEHRKLLTIYKSFHPVVLLLGLEGHEVHAALPAVVPCIEPVPLGVPHRVIIVLPAKPVQVSTKLLHTSFIHT